MSDQQGMKARVSRQGQEQIGKVAQGLLENPVVSGAVSAALGTRERASVPGIRYAAFVDPAGGSGTDSMTLAIGHEQDGTVILDAIRERQPPFSPADVVGEFSTLLKSYRVTKIVGDRYAGEWPREKFKEFGIRYEPAAKPKSDLYKDYAGDPEQRQG